PYSLSLHDALPISARERGIEASRTTKHLPGLIDKLRRCCAPKSGDSRGTAARVWDGWWCHSCAGSARHPRLLDNPASASRRQFLSTKTELARRRRDRLQRSKRCRRRQPALLLIRPEEQSRRVRRCLRDRI